MLALGIAVDLLGCTGTVAERTATLHHIIQLACALRDVAGDLFALSAVMSALQLPQVRERGLGLGRLGLENRSPMPRFPQLCPAPPCLGFPCFFMPQFRSPASSFLRFPLPQLLHASVSLSVPTPQFLHASVSLSPASLCIKFPQSSASPGLFSQPTSFSVPQCPEFFCASVKFSHLTAPPCLNSCSSCFPIPPASVPVSSPCLYRTFCSSSVLPLPPAQVPLLLLGWLLFSPGTSLVRWGHSGGTDLILVKGACTVPGTGGLRLGRGGG